MNYILIEVDTFTTAYSTLSTLCEIACLKSNWLKPVIKVVEDGVILLSWTVDNKKLNLYVSGDKIEFAKQEWTAEWYDDGIVESKRDLEPLWKWLNG